MNDKQDKWDAAMGIMLVCLFAIAVLGLIAAVVGTIISTKHMSEHEGFCKALHAEYVNDKDAGEQFCIRNQRVVWTWK